MATTLAVLDRVQRRVARPYLPYEPPGPRLDSGSGSPLPRCTGSCARRRATDAHPDDSASVPSGHPRGRCNKCDAVSDDKRNVQSPRRVDLLVAKARLVGHDEDLAEGSRPSYELVTPCEDQRARLSQPPERDRQLLTSP